MGDDNDKTIAYFEPTPPMSTYLAAFLVSDFECLGTHMNLLNESKIPVAVCVRPMFKQKAAFALNITIKAMKFYLETFQIDYPLPKLGNSRCSCQNKFYNIFPFLQNQPEIVLTQHIFIEYELENNTKDKN